MVITSSTRNRVGGNTPRGFESHLLRQNNSHPFGWLLFFAPKVGFERRLLETCQWHVSTAVGARRPTTSKIFNGCLPQKRNPTFSAGRAGGIQTHLKKFLNQQNFFSARQIFYHVNHRKSREKVRYFTDFTDNSRCLKISQIFSQFLLTKGDTPAIIYLVAERQAVHRERSMRVCWNW